MIEAIIMFKEGIQTHLTLNVSFKNAEGGIETNSKIGFIEFNELNDRIPSYMNILGNLLREQAKILIEE